MPKTNEARYFEEKKEWKAKLLGNMAIVMRRNAPIIRESPCFE